MLDKIIESVAIGGPLALVLFFIWYQTWHAWKDEREGRQKDQRRWTKFLMTHMGETVVEDDDEDET